MRDRDLPALHSRGLLQVIGEVLQIVNRGGQHFGQFGIEEELAFLRLAPGQLHHHADGGQWRAHLVRKGAHRLTAIVLFGEHVLSFQFVITLRGESKQVNVRGQSGVLPNVRQRLAPWVRARASTTGRASPSCSRARSAPPAPMVACSSAWYELRTSGPDST